MPIWVFVSRRPGVIADLRGNGCYCGDMIRNLTMLTIAAMSAGPLPVHAQWHPEAAGPASPNACPVLEAAYTAAISSRRPAAPVDVRPSSRSLELERFVPDYVTRMALEPGEFEDLVSRDHSGEGTPFQPDCRWDGAPTPAPHEHEMWVSFTHPLFSTDGRLALVEVSFFESGGWGFGQMCIVRRSDAGWSARCLESWIS